MPPKVLFLYISMSSGHQRAANAVGEALSLLAPTWESAGVDAFSFAYPVIGKLIARTYLEILRHTPVLWDYVYDNPDVEASTREIRELLNLASRRKMRSLLKTHNPAALVCTQAVPCSVFAAEKREGKLHIPLIAVITDFAIHSYWVHPEVDFYCVASEEARRYLIHQGLPTSKIAVTGIPISPSFLQRIPREKAREEFDLEPDRPTILVMGGSQGMGPLEQMIDALQAHSFQCLVTAGVNRDLFRTLQKRYQKDRKVRVFGYTKMVNTMMDAADLLITKPGGLTSSEALAKNLPMIICNPIPGQEERNARYLLKHGVAEQADDPADIARLAQTLFHHPARLKRMSEKTKEVATPYAAMEVARHVFRLIRATNADE